MDPLLQDLRYAFRVLLSKPWFTLAAVLCLALGIGVNTAVFSVINTFLVRPLPFPDADRLVNLYTQQVRQQIADGGFSPADLADLREQTTTLEHVGGEYGNSFNLSTTGDPVRVEGGVITHELFDAVGVAPLLGRNFLPGEDTPGGPKVVILSHGLWQNNYGGRADILGQVVQVSGVPRTIVGVMPPRFAFPQTNKLWIPMQADRSAPRLDRYVVGVARIRAGKSIEDVRRELTAISARLAEQHVASNRGWTFFPISYRDDFADTKLRTLLYLMLGSVACVLLIACANVANLLLARASGRAREIAVRAALGGSRARIVRQLLTESLLLALAGGAAGTIIAVFWLDWTTGRIPEELAYWITFDLDARVLVFTLILSLVTGIVFGTLPAVRATRTDLVGALKEGVRGTTDGARNGLRGILVGGQVSLSIVLLIGAMLMIRSFIATTKADLGFDTSRTLSMRTNLTGPQHDSRAARAQFYRRALDRFAALPGVRSAAATTALPGDDGGVTTLILAEGQPRRPGEELAVFDMGITPGLFETLAVPLLAGRSFTEQESLDSTSTALILNRELAATLWPGAGLQDVIGRRVHLDANDTTWYTVVGVAPSFHYDELGEEEANMRMQIYQPYSRFGWRTMSLVVSTDGDPAALAPLVRREMRALDPGLPVFDVRTMHEVLEYTTWDRRTFGEVFGSFGVLALVLAAVGVYGVMAYTVSFRKREIGIRMALGARQRDVVTLVLGQGMRVVAVGAVLGLVAGIGAARLMSSSLYGVSAYDPITFIAVPLLLSAVALLATYLPARQAASVDPVHALRAE